MVNADVVAPILGECRLIDLITPQECQNMFAAVGMMQTDRTLL